MQRPLPPTLFFILILAMLGMYGLDAGVWRTIFTDGAPIWGVGICAAIGLAFLFGAHHQFQRADAEIMTFGTPRNLVTTGFFRISRNPMYIGFLALLMAIALFVNIWQAVLAPLVFFLAAQFWYIPFEEKKALETFGEPYRRYTQQVRRWI